MPAKITFIILLFFLIPRALYADSFKICPPDQVSAFAVDPVLDLANDELMQGNIPEEKNFKRIQEKARILRRDLKEVKKMKENFNDEADVKDDVPFLLNDLFRPIVKFAEQFDGERLISGAGARIKNKAQEIKNKILELF